MKKRSVFIYSVVVSAIFVLALVAFGMNIFNEYKKGEKRALKDFENLITLIDKENIESESTKKKIKYSNFATIFIQKNDKTIFAYPSEEKINNENEKFKKIYEIQIYKNNERYNIHCAVWTLRPEIIFKSARTSFIIIAICTILTVALIFLVKNFEDDDKNNDNNCIKPILKHNSILEKISNKNSTEKSSADESLKDIEETYKQEEKEKNSEYEAEQNNDNILPSEKDCYDKGSDDNLNEDTEIDTMHESHSVSLTEIDNENHNIPLEEDLSSADEYENDEYENDAITPLITKEEMDAINTITLSDEYELDDDLNKNSNDASSISTEAEKLKEDYNVSPISENFNSTDIQQYSAVTGVKWEYELEKVLDEDLANAGAQEQDLALIIIKFSNYDYTDDITKEIVSELQREFQTNSRIFEYKNNSFAIIKSECTIEDAEFLCDTVHANLTNIIAKTQRKCYIGISARNIRVLSASRLIIEADQALCHAEDEIENPIIGFHVDIEKYKEYIKNIQD